MGLTLSDRNKIRYANWRNEGLTHNEIMKMIPELRRERFLKDIELTAIESHFGIKDKWFFVIIACIIFGTIVFALLL